MKISKRLFTRLVVLALALPVFAQPAGTNAVLWRDMGDAAALNLLDGPGEKTGGPGTDFKFIGEIKTGTAPKFDVEDERGAKWKVKLGPEVKPEVAATRLLWAAGYFADEDYYRAEIRVQGMPPLSRGKAYVTDGGLVREVLLERHSDGKKTGDWSWYDDRIDGTREFNGLRVLMALINNWDLKEENNAIRDEGDGRQRYVVSDLGASFGRTGGTFSRSKGKMKDYAESKFIEKVTPKYVDFVMHSKPFVLPYVVRRKYYNSRAKMESITRHIPIADARWIGNLLGRFSTEQIGDCFRAAGFSPAEVDGYTRVVVQRIDALKKL